MKAPGPRDAGRWLEAQRLFEEAIERPAAERREHLRSAAADDPWLLDAVLGLLASDEAPSPLDRPAEWPELGDRPEAPRASDHIGKYRLLEKLGAGGMGTVFRAEHSHGAIRQEVAIKVLHGHLSRRMGVRFVREQRILANLDHPGICRLQDFGVTDGGEAYLVMNLIDGVAVTEYADGNQLTVRARIGLFLE
ncbi:MAG: protein kinase, partial [Acidobacteriota bacterium]